LQQPTIAGLVLFETITSIDNAIINAEVLNTLGARAKRWFLTWGMFIFVFLIRFMLPWLIVYLANPSLGLIGALTATFSADPAVVEEIEESTKVLLIGGGTFLVLLSLTQNITVFPSRSTSHQRLSGFMP
jgi:uncharacterized protein